MPSPGDVVTVDFPGAMGVKRRPAVVVSSDAYHLAHPDVVLGVLTSNVSTATTTTDHVLFDWQVAGLRVPSAFRAYLAMALVRDVRAVGRLTSRDWIEVRSCLQKTLG